MTLHVVREATHPAAAGEDRDVIDPRFSWVVCLGKTREAPGGEVLCPHSGAVTMGRCLECRFLVTVERERSSLLDCSTERRDRCSPDLETA